MARNAKTQLKKRTAVPLWIRQQSKTRCILKTGGPNGTAKENPEIATWAVSGLIAVAQ
jgi:hypothetical protein